MQRVRLVADSTCDLARQEAKSLGIVLVPLYVQFGEDTYRDGVDITADSFMARLQSSAQMPKTSAPSPQDFRKAYEQAAQDAETVICVTVSSKWSGTYHAALRAAEGFSSARVEVLDSKQVSLGFGYGLRDAARAASDGASPEEVSTIITNSNQNTGIVAYVGTLEYLKRNGRIGKAASFLGSVLEIKPIITVTGGEAVPYRRVRTKRKAFETLTDWFKEYDNPSRVAIMWSTAEDDLSTMLEMLAPHYPRERIDTVKYGPVIGVHVGPGTTGLIVRK